MRGVGDMVRPVVAVSSGEAELLGRYCKLGF
jgi:hypothetical protein